MKEKQKTEFLQEKKGTVKKQRGAKNPQGTAFDLSDALTKKAPSARKKRITDPKAAIKKNSKNSSVKAEKSAEKGKKKIKAKQLNSNCFSGLGWCSARNFMELTTEIIPVAKAKLRCNFIKRFIRCAQ